jgi:hypothetical protein
MLKRLRGTPIIHHDKEWQMTYNPEPPYEVLQTKLIDFSTMQRIRRFARYWDLVGNSGNFLESTPLLWSDGTSPFYAFMRWSEWLHSKSGSTGGIALVRLMEFLFEYLTSELTLGTNEVAAAIWRDYQRGGRRDKPSFLRHFLPQEVLEVTRKLKPDHLPKRQARHQNVKISD